MARWQQASLEDATAWIPSAALVPTPALSIVPSRVATNIDAAVTALDGDPGRWRPHVKTHKSRWVVQRLLDAGVRTFKCATPAELRMLCESGVDDVLVALAVVGPTARSVAAIAAEFPDVAVSVLVDRPEHMAPWRGTRVGVFLDLDVGMHRTGLPVDDPAAVLAVLRAADEHHVSIRGLHDFDGHLASLPFAEREAVLAANLRRIAALVPLLAQHVPLGQAEVITGGTASFRWGRRDATIRAHGVIHRLGAGTIVFCDTTSIDQLRLPQLAPAVAVLASVLSAPVPGLVTCDAGSKAVSVDQGVPACAVAGHPGLVPQRPSEEHLPLQVAAGRQPEVGDLLVLLPRHVCTTVANFDQALLVEDGVLLAAEPVTARRRLAVEPAVVTA